MEEVLRVINASPGDLTPVFDAILQRAMHLCGAAFGGLGTWQEERFGFVAVRGPQPLMEYIANNEVSLRSRDGFSRVASGECYVQFTDISTSELYQSGEPYTRALVDLCGGRTTLSVPLAKNGSVLGVLAFFREEVKPFTDKEIALVKNFAAQAVIAMENARLLTETRESLGQQTATAEVLQVINSSPGDLTPVFDSILEKAHGLCGVDRGALQLYDGEYFRAVATRGLPDAVAALLREPNRPATGELRAQLLAGARYAHSADLAESEGYRSRPPSSKMVVDIGGTRSLLWVPLRKDGVLLGAISAGRTEVKPFSDKEIRLLENFAAQAVIAMENARLLGELRQRTDEVAELNRCLEARVSEQVEELGRVGRLKRFLAPQLAELIVSQGDEKILESHRREIVVVFCDLRGYTAFTETAEPEDALNFLRE
jgi:GAF domain-containing protein